MLRWTERAAADLFAIGEYIAADNLAAARSWVERLRQQAVKASKVPRAERVEPEIGREEVREAFLGTYRIVYRVVDDGIVVLTVFEGHRLLGKLERGLTLVVERAAQSRAEAMPTARNRVSASTGLGSTLTTLLRAPG